METCEIPVAGKAWPRKATASLMFMVVAAWSCLSTQALSPAAPSSSAKIQVWDNVIDTSIANALHQVASTKGLGHTLMHRGQQRRPPASLLEDAMEQILQALNDTSTYVEYWARQECRHIEAHADVDEYRAKAGGETRYPTNGHVFYLDIGPQVRGPTCLFPHVSSGEDLADDTNDDLSVLTVPAVSGRLLRFPGHWLHVVPRPSDIWMLPFVKGSPDFSDDFQRSVVLFNTWSKEPPMEVKPLSNDESSSCAEENEPKSLVLDFAQWQARDVLDNNSQADKPSLSQRTKIWLLGDLRRRNYTMRTVPLYSNGDALREALQEASQPMATPLSQVAVEA